MTLIMSSLARREVVQSTDRLVTRGEKPFDPLANKNVVFLAKDGLVCVGYTGPAFLGNPAEPTDRWIARVLAQDPSIQDDGHGSISLGYGRPARWFKVGQGLLVLCREISTALQARKSVYGPRALEIMAAGWQWENRGWRWDLARARPVLWRMDNHAVPRLMRASYLPRYWGWERRKLHLAAAPNSNIRQSEGAQVANSLSHTTTSTEVEQHLIDFMVKTAGRNPVVGADCMVVAIPHPTRNRTVTCRYVPVTDRGSLAYTPWIVGPDVVVAPTVFGENLEVPSGPFLFRFQGPHGMEIGPRGEIYLFRSQRRPRPTTDDLAHS